MNICGSFPEHPIVKVRIWKSKNEQETHVFVGKNSAAKRVLDKLERDPAYVRAISKEDTVTLSSTYGQNWSNRLGLEYPGRIRFVYETVYDDDSVSVVFKKLCLYVLDNTSENQVYAWGERGIKNNDSFKYNFATQLLRGKPVVDAEAVGRAFLNYTGRSAARSSGNYNLDEIARELRAFKPNLLRVRTAIGWRFVDGDHAEYVQVNPFLSDDDEPSAYDVEAVNELAMTMESYKLEGRLINATTYDWVAKHKASKAAADFYFPLGGIAKDKETDVSLYNQVETIKHSVQDYLLGADAFDATCHVNYVHLRLNETSLNPDINLPDLFDQTETTECVPFIKHSTLTNKRYKVDKLSLSPKGKVKIEKVDFDKWTEANPKDFKSKTPFEYVMFKVFLKRSNNADMFATVLVFADTHVDVKYNIRAVDKVTLEDVAKSFKRVNHLIDDIAACVPPGVHFPRIDLNYWTRYEMITEVKLVNMSTSIKISAPNANKTERGKMKTLVSNLFPYFNVIDMQKGQQPDDSISFQYKRIDNFVKQTNITIFLNQHISSSAEEKVEALQKQFAGMSLKDAESHVDSWTQTFKYDRVNVGKSVYFKPFSANCLLVKLGQNELGYNVLVNGITNVRYHQRIVGLLKFLIAHLGKANAFSFMKGDMDKDANRYDAEQEIEVDKGKGQAEDDLPDIPDLSMSENELNGLEDDDDDDFGNFNLDALLDELKDKEEQAGPSGLAGLVDDQDEQIEQLNLQLDMEQGEGKKKKQAFQYVLNRLKLADRVLFSGDYSKKCQWSQKRQPIVISSAEKADIDARFPGSYNNFIEYQRTKDEQKNIYICPEVWCPISKVSMSFEQFAAAGNTCPKGANEPAIKLDNNYFKKGEVDTGSNVKRYVAFSGDQNQCLPCCFKMNPDENPAKPNKNKRKIQECTQDLESGLVSNGPSALVDHVDKKYVLGPQYPLDTERFGVLPEALTVAFKNARFGRTGNGGSLSEGDSVFVRQGISGHQQSFLSCMNALLLESAEKNMVALLENHVTMRQFLIVNNGALFDMFLDPSRTIWDDDEFDAFCRWFIDGKLKGRAESMLKSIVQPYIYGFKLMKVRSALLEFHEGRQAHGQQFAYREKLRKHTSFKHILREYLVYNSYSNFLTYLHDDSVQKQHDVLLDLFNRQGSDVLDINPKGYNIILFEVDDGHMYVNCPFESQQTLDLTKPFVFVLKQDAFYEPVCRVSLTQRVFQHQLHFRYGEDAIVRDLVDFYRQRCKTSKKQASSGSSVFNYLTSIGRKVQHQVIDYNYKLVGFLIRNKASDDNMFVPCKPQTPVFIRTASYIYVDEVIGRIKKTDVDEAKDLFKQLYDLTMTTGTEESSDIYKVDKVIKAKDGSGEALGLRMKDGTFVPLCKDKIPQERYLDNLNIFIGYEENDPRKVYIENEETKDMLFRILKNEITRAAKKWFEEDRKKHTYAEDVEFLVAKDNPLPLWFKRRKMATIVGTFMKRITVLEAQAEADALAPLVVDRASCRGLRRTRCEGICRWSEENKACSIRVPEVWWKQFRDKIAETMLTRPMKMETIKLASNKNGATSEVAFEQHDVLAGKVSKIYEILMNPYVFIDKVVDNFVAKTLEERVEPKKTVTVQSLLTGEYVRLPTAFNKLFNKKTNETVTDEDMWINERENTDKSKDFLYNVFYIVGKLMNSRAKMRMDIFQKLVQNRLIEDIKDIGEEEMIAYLRAYNTQINFKMTKEAGFALKTMEDIKSFMAEEKKYYMSEYELGIVARILQINILIIGRKTLRNPNSMKCISPMNRSQSYLILHSKEYVDKKKARAHDTYSMVVKNKNSPQVIFNESDLNDKALEYIRETCKTVHVIINE
jgi:hypothetical protein